MPGDDPKPRRAPSIMGDAERAAIGREHRRKSAPIAVPVIDDAAPQASDLDEVTSPHDLLERDLTEEEEELCGDQRDRPATYAQIIKLTTSLTEAKKREKRDRRKSADQTMAVLDSKGPPLERLAAVERKLRLIWALLAAAGTAAAGSIITVGKGLYDRGADDGAQRVRFEQYERDAERVRIDLRDLRDHLDDRFRARSHNDAPAAAWPPTSKGPTP